VAYTLANLVTYCQKNGWRDQTADGTTQLKAWINDVIRLLATARDWPFFRKPYDFGLTAPYTTGTVALTNGSATVTGTGTTWVAGMVGQEFYCSGLDSDRVYRISARNSNTEIEISPSFLGTTGSGETYTINYVRYTGPTDFDRGGAFYDQTGREMRYNAMTLEEFYRRRQVHRTTVAWPTDIVVDQENAAGGTVTTYFYVADAPSTARMVRTTYYRNPATTDDNNHPDWPERYRYLLHKALKVEMASGDKASPGLAALADGQLQRDLDAVYRRVVTSSKVIPIRTGGPGQRLKAGEHTKWYNILQA
jgi:hypothetical protein